MYINLPSTPTCIKSLLRSYHNYRSVKRVKLVQLMEDKRSDCGMITHNLWTAEADSFTLTVDLRALR